MMRSDIALGGSVPEYELPDRRSPSAYTRIVTISTDNRHPSQEFRASVEGRDLREVTRGDPPRGPERAGLRDAWNAGDVSNFHGSDQRGPVELTAERKRVAR